MEPASLTSLPDDLLLDIVEYLDNRPRHITSRASRQTRTHRLVQQAGWKTFVKTRFPSLRVPHSNECSWSNVADTLSYLDRCWDKRAIQLSLFRPCHGRGQMTPHLDSRGKRLTFTALLMPHYVPSLDEEVVALGAGEDLHVRWGGDATQTWKSVLGASTTTKYAPGTGDATCLNIIERRAGLPEIVVGRANGDVQVLSPQTTSPLASRPRRLSSWTGGRMRIYRRRLAFPRVAWPSPARTGSPTQTCWRPAAARIFTCTTSPPKGMRTPNHSPTMTCPKTGPATRNP
ncbi:hypothetical protein J3459_008157 [Metarhizium acridum]|nr:hypothetical protein J3459_008157 [Metarhizium acridum]